MKKVTTAIAAVCTLMSGCTTVEGEKPQYQFVEEWRVDFETTLSTDWKLGDWAFESNLCEFTPSQFSVNQGNGVLSITAKDSATEGVYSPDSAYTPYWGAELYSEEKAAIYGRWGVRMQPNAVPGTVVSFFLANYQWNSDWSALTEGCEIDIEFAGRTDQVELALHYTNPQGTLVHVEPVPVITLPVDAGNAMHLWEIEVTPEAIRYYFDSTLIHEVTDAKIVAEMAWPMATRLNYWVSDAPEWVGTFDATKLPLSTRYDDLTFSRWEKK